MRLKPGETVWLPELAGTLSTIAEGGPEAFYKGPLAEKTAAYVQEKEGMADCGGHSRSLLYVGGTSFRRLPRNHPVGMPPQHSRNRGPDGPEHRGRV